jgi:bifunctional non-homologous end joining protein LigD
MPRKDAERLSRYRAKRDFAKTSEPAGLDDAEIRHSDHLRFVVHKHDATRLHYDLRLEVDGVFHSWAVTRGPSLDPSEKRLAVEVEEHPLAYGDFEGTIPEGEYGGGTVMIWDRGFWAPEKKESVAASLKKGELKFAMAGSKLQGSWVLVRLKPKEGETRRNWLLIKHRDEWSTPGRDSVLRMDKSVASGRTMAAIKAGREPPPETFITTGKRIGANAQWSSADAARTTQELAKPALHATKLTRPDRLLWPESGFTKQDLADYLLSASPWMIAHLRGRPCSLLRAPEGIGGDTFFQRHSMPGLPKAITEVIVAGDEEPFIQIDDAQALVDLAQLSAIEFHPWNSVPFKPELPGRLVFDLDPGPDVPFDDVVAAARDLRQSLEMLGLVPFCKTTGGKGLHVVTPLTLEGQFGWEQAKLFSQTVAAQLAAARPERFLTKISKRLRHGRIFVDYLRNDWKATAVAPLSPRAWPGALVSMPLNWTQVRKGLDPTRFTLKTALGMLEQSDAWRSYEKGRRSLEDAIGKLLESG